MPLVVAPLFAFALGTLLALGPRGPLAERERRFATTAAACLAALCFFPVAAYAAAGEPAWSALYLADAARIPAVLLVAAAAVSAAFLPAGLRAGTALVGAPIERRIALVIAPALAAVTACVVHADRLAVVGTQLAFLRSSERALRPLGESRFGATLIVLDLLLVVGSVLTYRALARLGEAPSEPRARYGRPRLGLRSGPRDVPDTAREGL
jgi:hypothetical protein